MMTLYGVKLSGHTHRVQALLSILGLEYTFAILAPHAPALLAMNPLGQVPVLRDGDLVLCDSNAIMVYLCKRYGAGTGWLPEDAAGAAHVQRWLSIAAGELRQGPAAARMTAVFANPGEPPDARDRAARFLTLMEAHLAQASFLATTRPTIADLACYAYVARAPEGHVPLEPYANVRAWLRRIEAIEGFAPMPWASDN